MRKLLSIILIMTLLTGCAAGTTGGSEIDSGSESGSTTEEGSSQIASGSETESETEPTPSEPVVTEILISAAGDCTLAKHHKAWYEDTYDWYFKKYGAEYFLEKVKPVFEADDFTLVNLECVLSTTDTIMPNKTWNMKGDPSHVNVLTSSSVEGVSLANNHIMDYLEQGAEDTIHTVKEAGLSYAISSAWGYNIGIYEVKGIKIGFVSVSQLEGTKLAYNYLEEGMEELKAMGAQIKLAAIHWGIEGTNYINDTQKDMGRWCIDNGYDLVLGSHPHVLQGIEEYNGKYIVYSLGNFSFGGNRNPGQKETMIFQNKFTLVDGVLQPEMEASIVPCRISSITEYNNYQPVVLEGEEAATLFAHMNTYSAGMGITIDEEGNIHSAE